jgi:hypothetical protein
VVDCDRARQLRRQHSERWRRTILSFSPNAPDRNDRRSIEREAMLGFRIILSGELEECRCKDQTSSELPEPFTAELEHRPPRGRDGGS